MILPIGLRDLKIEFGLTRPGIEAALETLIRNSPDDYSARSRLRLLRICTALYTPNTPWKTAIMVVANRGLNKVHYDILGHGDNSRMTIATLADAAVSPVCEALDRLRVALESFSPDNPEWSVLVICGGPEAFVNTEVRRQARTQLIGAGAGLDEYFDKHLAGPPFMLAPMCRPKANDDETGAVKRFFLFNDECMPLGCQRLKILYPTEVFRQTAYPPAVSSNPYTCIMSDKLLHVVLSPYLPATPPLISYQIPQRSDAES